MVSGSRGEQTGPKKARPTSAKRSRKPSRKSSGRSYGKRRILWIPGLRADRRMYGPLQRSLDRIMPGKWDHHFIDFPDSPQSLTDVKSLQQLAEKTLESSIQPLQTHHKENRPYYDTVVGVSMGGMLAQILVGQNLLHTENLVLISTAYRGKDLRQPFLAFARIPGLLPGFLRSLVQWIIGKAYPLFRKNVAEAKQFAEMFLQFPQKIFFDAPIWIKKWSGEQGLQATLAMKPLPPDSQSVRVFRIHGTSDPLLSYKKIKDRIHLDLVIQKGSHIVFATHSDTIADELQSMLESDSSLPDYWLPEEQASRATDSKKGRSNNRTGPSETGERKSEDNKKQSRKKRSTRKPASNPRAQSDPEESASSGRTDTGEQSNSAAGNEAQKRSHTGESSNRRRRRPRNRKKMPEASEGSHSGRSGKDHSNQNDPNPSSKDSATATEQGSKKGSTIQGQGASADGDNSARKGSGGRRRRPRRPGKKKAASS